MKWAVGIIIGAVLGIGGYAAWQHATTGAGALTASGTMRPVHCANPTNVTTCTPVGAAAATFEPRQLVEIDIAFSQPTDTQTTAIVPHMADGSGNRALRPAPLSQVMNEPLLVMRACDLGSTQSVANDTFDIVRDGVPTPIGHFTLTVQAPSGVASNACR